MPSNPNAVLSPAEARHLLRRTGFGAPADQLQTLLSRYRTRGAAADWLLNFTPVKFKPRGKTIDALHDRWIKYMITGPHPLQEKLVLFWHDHFATGNDKVDNPPLMANQNQLLRRSCLGNFKDLVKAVNRDAAMMEYLDTVRNRKRQPNENYARELQELFTLGVADLNGTTTYDQDDIVQIARAFTGWDYDAKGRPEFNAERHDTMDAFPERGAKVIYRAHGGFGSGGRDFTQPGGEGPAEIDQVVDIIFEHRDSDGQNTVARHIARKLFAYFAYADPSREVLDAIVAEAAFDTTWSISTLVRAIVVHDAFYDTAAAAPAAGSTPKSVTWPVDHVVSTLRLLKMKLKGSDQRINYSSRTPIRSYLASMGQVLFQPPSVFGWDWEHGWVSSATLLARYDFATDIIAARGSGSTAFRPERLVDLDLTDAGTIVDAVTDVLGVTDQFSSSERAALLDYLTDGNPTAALDLHNDGVRNTKLNGLFGLVLQSPAYQVH